MPTTFSFSYRIFVPLILCVALAACGGGGHGSCTAPPCNIGQRAEFLYATSITGQVLSLPVDPRTGALGTADSVPGPSTSLGLTAAGSQFVYASDFQNGLIYAYFINANNGSLAPIAGSPFPQGVLSLPSGLATVPAGDFLYAAVAGGVDGFSINRAGLPAPIAGSPFASGGNLQIVVDPSGKFLFAPDIDPPGGVFAFSIDSTSGALTAVPGSPFTFPGQTVLNSNPIGIVVDSTGHFVYVTLGATNQIAGFSIVNGTGALTPVPGSPFVAGDAPFLLAATGKFLYVTTALDHTVSGYSIESANGVLTPVAGSPFSFPVLSLVTDPSGKFLYGAGGGGISGFIINSNGSLTQLPGSPFPAAAPLLLTIVETSSQGG
jgi:6-phosphogluconolactonase